MADPNSSGSNCVRRAVNKPAALADLPEIVAYKRRRKRLLLSLGAVIVTGVLGAKPAYLEFKRWRCRDLVAKSSVLLSEGKLEEALSTARAAHLLAPQESQALRALGQVLYSRRDYQSAGAFFAEVMKGTPIAGDRLQLAECHLRGGRLRQAETELVHLLAEEGGASSTHLFAARVYAARGDVVSATAATRKAVELAPTDDARLFLGQLLTQSEKSREEGLTLLRAVSREKSLGGLSALLQLASRPGAGTDERLEIATGLRLHPLAKQPEQLRALELQIQALPGQRTVLLDSAEEKYQASEPAELRTFAAWLISQRDHERALRLLPIDRVVSRKDLFLVRLDAMAALGQWREIVALLEERVPLEAALVHLYRARCWQEMSDPAKAASSWKLALTAGTADPNVALYLASYAERIGALDHAERAYRVLSNNPKTARHGFDGLLRITPRTNSVALRELLSEMSKLWPHDTAVTNDLAYLNILLGKQVSENRKRARELVAASPGSLPHRTVLALAELREGDPKAALRVYDGLQIDWKTAAPGAAAVYVSVLRHTGYLAEAATLAASLKGELLRPEERELLAGIATP